MHSCLTHEGRGGRGRRDGARARAAALLLLALAAAPGCSSSPKPKPAARPAPAACATFPLEIFVQASAVLNHNELGQPMPVEVRVLLLRDRARFDAQTFDTLRQEPERALGTDLLHAETFVVFPGKMEIRPLRSPGATSYVALVALFREHAGPLWRQVFDVRRASWSCGPGALHEMVHITLERNIMRRAR